MINMKNKYKSNNWKEYYCEITEELDKICGFESNDTGYHFRHYVVDERDIFGDNILAIRFPGRTTGSIYLDENNIIISCTIDDTLCGEGKYYPSDINETLKKYIGEVIS